MSDYRHKPMGRLGALTLWEVTVDCAESKYGFATFKLCSNNHPDFGITDGLIEQIKRITDLPVRKIEFACFWNDRSNEVRDLRSKLEVTESRLRRAEADFAEAKHGWHDENIALDS